MPQQQYTCTVLENKVVTPTVFELTFRTEPELKFVGGQFISVIIDGKRRSYSLASPPEANPMMCIKRVGEVTNLLSALKPGDTFQALGPFGHFVYEPKKDRRLLFVATGTGVAPFRSMFLSERFKNDPPLSTIGLLGVTHAAEILYEQELGLVPVVSREPNYPGYKGRVTDYLKSLDIAFPWNETEFYLCGNGDMVKEVSAWLTAKGIPRECLHREVYFFPAHGTPVA